MPDLFSDNDPKAHITIFYFLLDSPILVFLENLQLEITLRVLKEDAPNHSNSNPPAPSAPSSPSNHFSSISRLC